VKNTGYSSKPPMEKTLKGESGIPIKKKESGGKKGGVAQASAIVEILVTHFHNTLKDGKARIFWHCRPNSAG